MAGRAGAGLEWRKMFLCLKTGKCRCLKFKSTCSEMFIVWLQGRLNGWMGNNEDGGGNDDQTAGPAFGLK